MKVYDFFISYKWDKFSEQSKELLNIVRSRGFEAWLDVENPFQEEVNGYSEALAAHLVKAMESCRFVLFFETFAVMAKQVGGPDIRVTSWQERELDMANSEKLITLYHEAVPKSIGFGTSTKLHEYQDLSDAFTMIESAIIDTTSHFWAG